MSETRPSAPPPQGGRGPSPRGGAKPTCMLVWCAVQVGANRTIAQRSCQGKAQMQQREEGHLTAEDQRAVDGVSEAIDTSVINPRSMLPAYLQLAICLRGAIIVRQLPPGSPLPSEPDLTKRYRVSRDTARRAMR